MRSRLNPSTVIASAALFVALGGSASALTHSSQARRCAAGTVRGDAAVTGEPAKGIANVPNHFSGTKSLFSKTSNCSGAQTQVQRAGVGVYDVRFIGNPATVAVASSGAETTVQRQGDAFQVSLWVAGRADPIDTPFMLVAF